MSAHVISGPLMCTLVHDSTVLTAFNALGLLVTLIFICRWWGDKSKRRRERGSITADPQKYLTPSGRAASYLGEDQMQLLPSVAFIMPVKWNSIKAASPVDNWRSQVLTGYRGEHESIFVVESEDDGAVEVLQGLQKELEGQASIRIVVAGLSKMCTQKIHNMVAGVEAASPSMEYVLFLDANGHMHAGTVGVMVEELVNDKKVFAVSGFPLDIPQAGASVWAWTMCQYRYVVLSEFSQHRTTFPWGGAMLMRRAEIENDVCQIKTRWLDGGYSDDLMVGACALDHGRTISTPLRALFPNTVKKDVTFAQSWDFMRRQAFTLTTFGSTRHFCVVSGILFLYGTFTALPLPGLIIAYYAGISTPICAAVQQSWEPLFDYNFMIGVAFIAAFGFLMILQRRYLRECWNMARSLSPGHEFTEFYVSRTMQVASFLLETSLAPFIALSLIRRSSEWGGIMYHVQGGKVVRIERPKAATPTAPVASPGNIVEMSKPLQLATGS